MRNRFVYIGKRSEKRGLNAEGGFLTADAGGKF